MVQRDAQEPCRFSIIDCHSLWTKLYSSTLLDSCPLFKKKKIYIYIDLFLAVLGLRCFMGFSLVAGSGGNSSCSVQASHCGGLSCGVRAVRREGFHSCDTCDQSSWLLGSKVLA